MNHQTDKTALISFVIRQGIPTEREGIVCFSSSLS
jgi:hypothetical protein